MSLTITPLNPVLGAEVTGIDLAGPLDATAATELRHAFEAYHVLVFPGQPIDDAAHVRFSRHFGELEIFPRQVNRSALLPAIFQISNVGPDNRLLPVDGDEWRYLSDIHVWHTDSSYREIPSKGAILHGIEIPPSGGDTLWCNLFAVYEALPDDLRQRIRGRTARNSIAYQRSRKELPPLAPEEAAAVPPVAQKLARTHPDGRTSLYISPCYIDTISGLDFAESQALLAELVEFAGQERFVYRHIWQPHDVVMWDNRCTMHRVEPFDAAHQRRVMHRTALVGDEPVA
jgi:alpha-ketoglutarate-dependent taurine dioxygenase